MSGDNTLGEVAKFIADHAKNSFDHMLSKRLTEASVQHTSWADFCPEGHSYGDVPCDTYEDALALGISWLMAQVEDAGKGVGS